MKTVTFLMLGVSALAIAGCTNLPGASLGATFGAERYLNAEHGGADFNGSLAKEYAEVGRRAGFRDTLWMNSTAYIAKAKQAEAGVTPAPWTPAEVGVNGDAGMKYEVVMAEIAANMDERPAACARAQAMWDQYLEALRGDLAGSKFCVPLEDALAMLREAVVACAQPYTVYFGFNRTDLTDTAQGTLDDVVDMVNAFNESALSGVGHADTVGSVTYNQGLSERRATRVARALADRGVAPAMITTAGRSELEPAVPTADNVREPLNRRVEITTSN